MSKSDIWQFSGDRDQRYFDSAKPTTSKLWNCNVLFISKKLIEYEDCAEEIESEVVSFLAQITESSAVTKDPLTIAGKRRVV